jgi:TRAP-type C4-dicarboxylate transport system permease large subunit
MSATSEVIIAFVVMGIIFYLGFKAKLTVGIIMILASLVAAFVVGFGLPIQHLVEGTFYFEVLMSIIITGMVFIGIMRATGALDAITRFLMSKFYNYPSLLLAILAVIVMFPAMITGSTPVAMLSTGVLVAPILLRMGIPKLETAAIISMAALMGQSAPPVNVMVMIICTSTFMPYEGFGLPLALLTFPLAILSAIVLGRKYVTVPKLKELVEEDFREKRIFSGAKLYVLFAPLIALVILMVLPRVSPFGFPDPSMPFNFMICALIALFTGVKRINFFTESLNIFREAFVVMVLFVGMGVFVHFMSLVGGSGLLATTTVSLPRWALYLSTAIAPPLIGGPIVPFGTSAIIGPPIVLAFSNLNAIIVTTGLSLLLSLGCLAPPTALSSLFAARIVGIENYLAVTKRCWPLALLTVVISLLVIYFANPISTFLGL